MIKKILLSLAFVAVAYSSLAQFTSTTPSPMREHRAIWMSSMLGSTWPGTSLTASNAEVRKTALRTYMSRLKNQGINAVYYHVRANCDATYASSYEPYASSVAGTRGGTPAFDPFGFLVEAAHDAGIEVYAWVNPYRYSSGATYGAGERNYENSHPEWLIRQTSQIILNPGIPEVQDRIEDIITEIVTNYDIDGMIFDDYFYTSGTPFSLDAEQYNVYKSAGGTLAQDVWRRENVNETVRRAHDTVKRIRPYAVFAISPAGRISPPNIGSYGLEEGPYGDMNYSTMHADPIHWLDEGWLDFLSPQVYWSNYFDKLTDWYSIAVPHFGRHLYTSVDCSQFSSLKAAQYIRQIDYMREALRPNENGVVFFDYGAYVNAIQVVDGTRMQFGDILANSIFKTKVTMPLRRWDGIFNPVMVSNLRREGLELKWGEPQGNENRRYVVYAIPSGVDKATFAGEREYITAIRYTNSYTIPEEESDCTFAVAVYDRYGNEYSPVIEGLVAATAQKASLTYPADGNRTVDMFSFIWTGTPGRYRVEVSENADFSTIIGMNECSTTTMLSNQVADFTEGKTYYWRVRTFAPNAEPTVSDVSAFVAGRIVINTPTSGQTGVSTTPRIEWAAGPQGTSYLLEVSTNSAFTATMVISEEVETPYYEVPAKTLNTGRTYYARVTATNGNIKSVSPVVSFSTINRNDYAAPVMLNPATDGQTIHSNESITFAEWDGMVLISLEISTSTSFPVRGTTYKGELRDFATSTPTLENIRISSKPMEDGTTYYVRARGMYMLTTSSSNTYTGYTPVRSFIYSAQAGVDVAEAADAGLSFDADAVLHLPSAAKAIAVYDLAGRCIIAMSTDGRSEISLKHLAHGVYIISVEGLNIRPLKVRI